MDKLRERRFNLRGGAQHGSTIGGKHLGLPPARNRHFRIDAPKVEQSPAKAEEPSFLACIA